MADPLYWPTVGLFVATLGLVLATLVGAGFAWALWRVTKAEAKRNTAVLEVRQTPPTEPQIQLPDACVFFEIWNRGLKSTQIGRVYLTWTKDTGEVESKPLSLYRKTPPVRVSDGSRSFSGSVGSTVAKREFWLGSDTLDSGSFWEFQAWIGEGANPGIRTGPRPTLHVVPVLGAEIVVPIEDHLKMAIRHGRNPERHGASPMA